MQPETPYWREYRYVCPNCNARVRGFYKITAAELKAPGPLDPDRARCITLKGAPAGQPWADRSKFRVVGCGLTLAEASKVSKEKAA